MTRGGEIVPQHCQSPYGVCPLHGRTLNPVRHGDRWRTVCTAPACLSVWPGDRLGEDCDQAITHQAWAPAAGDAGTFGTVFVCRAHAEQLVDHGWSVATHARPDADADRALAAAARRTARRISAVLHMRQTAERMGYRVLERGDLARRPDGTREPVTVTFTGRDRSMAARLRYDEVLDLYVWDGAHTPDPVHTWERLERMLAAAAGAELQAPAALPAPVDLVDGNGLDRDEAGTALGAALPAGWADHAAGLGYRLTVDALPLLGALSRAAGAPRGGPLLVSVRGYGNRYVAGVRYDEGIGRPVLAGVWEVDGFTRPATWSTWPAFAGHLVDVAEQAADAVT